VVSGLVCTEVVWHFAGDRHALSISWSHCFASFVVLSVCPDGD
jgi:hypothetical protein